MADKPQEEWTADEWWAAAAVALGWEFSPAYNGYIRPDYHPDGPAHQFASYPSELAAEDACFIDGVGSLGDAVKLVLDRAGKASEDDYFAIMRKFFSEKTATKPPAAA